MPAVMTTCSGLTAVTHLRLVEVAEPWCPSSKTSELRATPWVFVIRVSASVYASPASKDAEAGSLKSQHD